MNRTMLIDAQISRIKCYYAQSVMT